MNSYKLLLSTPTKRYFTRDAICEEYQIFICFNSLSLPFDKFRHFPLENSILQTENMPSNSGQISISFQRDLVDDSKQKYLCKFFDDEEGEIWFKRSRSNPHSVAIFEKSIFVHQTTQLQMCWKYQNSQVMSSFAMVIFYYIWVQ